MAVSDSFLAQLNQLSKLADSLEAKNREKVETEKEYQDYIARLRDLETKHRGECSLCPILLENRNRLQKQNDELSHELFVAKARIAGLESVRK